MVNITIKLTKIEIETLLLLADYNSIIQIAKYRQVSRVAVYKVVQRLMKKGLLNKTGTIYELNEAGKKRLTTLIGVNWHSIGNKGKRWKIRLHDLVIKVDILDKPDYWTTKKQKIVILKQFNKEVSLKNNRYQMFDFSNFKVKTTTKSVIFYLPNFYEDNAETCYISALRFLEKAIATVENLFKITLTKSRKTNIEVISNHFARIEDSLAKKLRKEGDKLYVFDENKVWLISDFSLRRDELETISPGMAEEDMNTVHNFFNDLRRNPIRPSEVLQITEELARNQQIMARNTQSHLPMIHILEKTVKDLNALIGKKKVKEHINLNIFNKKQRTLLEDFEDEKKWTDLKG